MTFGFREPYQVIGKALWPSPSLPIYEGNQILTQLPVDAEMVQDSCKFKMDLAAALERTVHGKVKPSTSRCPTTPHGFPPFPSLMNTNLEQRHTVITQCEIRKLYAKNNERSASEAIDVAKNYERRRCGHHPDEYPEPLSTLECLNSVVDPKQTGQNKHRYVVASQSQEVRRMLRGVRAVPLIYIKRSVMILEPMADESVQVRAREEKAKFRAEIRSNLGKRKRAEDGGGEGDDEDIPAAKGASGEEDKQKKKKKKSGPKEPNPLSVKKSKKKTDGENAPKHAPKPEPTDEEPSQGQGKRKKRKRGKGGKGNKEGGEANGGSGGDGSDDE